jgi:hypothetical protein
MLLRVRVLPNDMAASTTLKRWGGPSSSQSVPLLPKKASTEQTAPGLVGQEVAL